MPTTTAPRSCTLDGVLEVIDVHRRFGDRVALDGVTLSVAPYRIVGFVGRNGAGKTTTMRAILGLVRPDAGEVRWRGSPVTDADRARFGYLPEERGLYPKMRVRDQLVFLAELSGVPRPLAHERAETWVCRLGLEQRADDRVETLSLGNQQRVQLAAALVHDPEVLVCDEPFSGLDPVGVDLLAAVLREEAARGVGVLFSSHQLDLVEDVCDDVVIIDAGRVVEAGPVRTRDERPVAWRVEVRGAPPGWWCAVAGAAVDGEDGAGVVVRLDGPGTEQDLLGAAVAVGRVQVFAPHVPSLADRFRAVAGAGVAATVGDGAR